VQSTLRKRVAGKITAWDLSAFQLGWDHDLLLESSSGRGGWIRFARFAMKRFGYLRDRLFLMAAGGYTLNRWLLKALLPSPFLHNHFNDLLLIPAAFPVVLWGQRVLGLRNHDRPPSWQEMLLHLGIWSMICEVVGPFWLQSGTADIWDVAVYAVGGVAAYLWWNCSERRCSTSLP